jgi:hypothetical protein
LAKSAQSAGDVHNGKKEENGKKETQGTANDQEDGHLKDGFGLSRTGFGEEVQSPQRSQICLITWNCLPMDFQIIFVNGLKHSFSCQFRNSLITQFSSSLLAYLEEGMRFGEEHDGTGQNAGQSGHANGANAATDGLLNSMVGRGATTTAASNECPKMECVIKGEADNQHQNDTLKHPNFPSLKIGEMP